MSSHPNFTDHLQNSDEEANLGFQKYERGYLSTPRNTRFEYDKSSAVVDDDEEEEEDRSLLSPKHEKSFGTLKRGITTLARKAKTITLASSGNFIIKQKIPYQILDDAIFKNGEEFETLRYTACTTDPDRFVEKNYSLRVSNLKRNIEIFVVVTMYNEDENAFNRTLFALAQNIQYLCEKNKYGWDENSWQKVAICIVGDGRSKIHENVLKVLSVLGVYQDGIAQSAINKKETVSHIFEYTAQKIMDESRQIWSSKHKIPPLQLIFCLKEKNAKKINSHRWFFKAMCPLVNPKVCVLIDVGTKPERSALYYLWKAFFINPQIAGACGEIRADLGRGMTRIKNFCNPLTASQNFEYKISNLVDKALESVFGYISVLPGAFSAYRYVALLDSEPGVGPLCRYFEGEVRQDTPQTSSIFAANLYLAEDRILCFELISKKNANWVLHYVKKAYADTDVPDSVPEFLSQRRRWLNGSLFAGFYALANFGSIWTSNHSFLRKLVFTVQFFFNVLNQIFSWFILGNFALTFYFLFQELQSMVIPPGSTATVGWQQYIVRFMLDLAKFSYPVVLICLFVISFGNRPQAFAGVYKAVMFGFGIIGAAMFGMLVHRLYILLQYSIISPPLDPLMTMLDGLNNEIVLSQLQELGKDPKLQDSAQFLVSNILFNITGVIRPMVILNVKYQQIQAYTYLIALASSFGVFYLASFIQRDFYHMFTCLLQYLLMLPSYINVLTIYALSNLHDVSWGTKGDTKVEALPQVQSVTNTDGSVTANINVVSDRNEISALYAEIITELQSPNIQKQFKPLDTFAAQEDEYKGFRTKLLLSYLATNALLFGVCSQLGSVVYIMILLIAIAFLSVMKIIGVILFVTFIVLNDLFKCCISKDGRNKFKKSNPNWQPSLQGSLVPTVVDPLRGESIELTDREQQKKLAAQSGNLQYGRPASGMLEIRPRENKGPRPFSTQVQGDL